MILLFGTCLFEGSAALCSFEVEDLSDTDLRDKTAASVWSVAFFIYKKRIKMVAATRPQRAELTLMIRTV